MSRARAGRQPLAESARLGHSAIVLRRQQGSSALCQRTRNAARASQYMPKVIKRLRNFGYRVPFLRRRFQLEDLLLVGVAVGGSFAVVLFWFVWVHWRIL